MTKTIVEVASRLATTATNQKQTRNKPLTIVDLLSGNCPVAGIPDMNFPRYKLHSTADCG
jgi:hypothetical protein